MKAVRTCVCIHRVHNIDYVGSYILREDLLVHHVVFSDSWLDVMVRHNKNILLIGFAPQDLYLYDREVKKVWVFEEVLLTLLLSFLVYSGRSPP
jgi:hypothetical protein